MKRKFILLPITLTALTPIVGLCGCKMGGGGDTPGPTPEGVYNLDNFTYTESGDYFFYQNNVNLFGNKWYEVDVDTTNQASIIQGSQMWKLSLDINDDLCDNVADRVQITESRVWINDKELNFVQDVPIADMKENEFSIKPMITADHITHSVVVGKKCLDGNNKIKITFKIDISAWYRKLNFDIGTNLPVLNFSKLRG